MKHTHPTGSGTEGQKKVSQTCKNYQSLLTWERDRYCFLGTHNGERLFLTVNVLRDGDVVRVRLRISRRTREGKWETLGTTYLSVWEFLEVTERLEGIGREVLSERFGGGVR